jgi:hypothetical protein
LIVNVALAELVPNVAVIVAVALAPDVCVVLTVNVVDVCPAAIVTDVPTVAEEEFDASVTVLAVDCAAEIVTVPVEGFPAVTVLGLRVTEETVCAIPKHGTSSASNKKRNFIGDLMILRSFVICSVCGIDAPQNQDSYVSNRKRPQ